MDLFRITVDGSSGLSLGLAVLIFSTFFDACVHTKALTVLAALVGVTYTVLAA